MLQRKTASTLITPLYCPHSVYIYMVVTGTVLVVGVAMVTPPQSAGLTVQVTLQPVTNYTRH